jgi:hypothetical protein
MYTRTEPNPADRRAAAEYRFALITRDYRRLRSVSPSWWPSRRGATRRTG